MKPRDFIKLEKDYNFKKSYLKETPWWKNFLFVAPVCLLFGGLVGVMYLLNNGMLVSWYSLPFLILFMLGTIALKSVRIHIQKLAINKEDSFLVSLALPIGELKGYVYTIFVTDNHRHNEKYIKDLAQSIDATPFIGKYENGAKKKSVLINGEGEYTDFYVRAYSRVTLNKRSKQWEGENYIPILYIDDKYTFVIKKRDLMG